MAPEKDTAAYFQFIHDLSAPSKKPKSSVGEDPVRLQRQEERRERLGQLRARPKKKGKSSHVHSVFGYSDLS